MFEIFTKPRPGWEMAPYIAATIILFVVILAIIHPLATSAKKRITMALAFVGGSFYLLEFLLPANIYIGRTVHTVDKVPYSAVVKKVKPDATAGALQPGDTVLMWAKRPTTDYGALNTAVSACGPDEVAEVTVLRNSVQTTLQVKMPPAPPKTANGDPAPPPVTVESLGLSVQNTGNPFTPYVQPLGSALRIFLALALMLGIVNLFRVNGRTLMRRRTGSWYALAFFVGFFAMVTVWALKYYHPGVSNDTATLAAGVPQNFVPGRMGQYAGWYNVVYNGGFNSLGSTMFSLLAFFIVSAAYRAFRVRSAESVLLLGSAVVMMLGLTPLGTAFITGGLPLTGFASNFRLENVSEWILLVLNAAAQRALLFGVAVGLMATSLRIWLSLERGQFFDAEL